MKPAATRNRTPEPPFCWQSKEALRLIRRYMEGKDQWLKISSRLVFYLALCEMASNKGSESFVCSQKSLKDLCGLSEHTQTEIIKDLESAGVITACSPPNGVQGQKRYTLLSRSEVGSERSELHGVGVSSSDVRSNNRRTVERTGEEHPPTPLDCVEDVCEFPPGSNGSKGGNIPVADEVGRREPAKATVEPVAAKAAGGEAPPARACRAREKPAAGGRADDGGFAEFWTAYPRKVGKRDAGVRGPGSGRHCRRFSPRLRRGGTHRNGSRMGADTFRTRRRG